MSAVSKSGPQLVRHGPTMFQYWPNHGPRWSEMVPKWSHNGPTKGPKHGPSMVQHWSKNGPQLVPKGSKRGPSMVHSWSQKGSQTWPQHGPTLVPKGSKHGPSTVPKMAPASDQRAAGPQCLEPAPDHRSLGEPSRFLVLAQRMPASSRASGYPLPTNEGRGPLQGVGRALVSSHPFLAMSSSPPGPPFRPSVSLRLVPWGSASRSACGRMPRPPARTCCRC